MLKIIYMYTIQSKIELFAIRFFNLFHEIWITFSEEIKISISI